ncbi:hypothetical protein BY458DRAFT_436466 [Sporodiniella umbellata]|nr:hypothetical protein BY458DRAFT_436466 [Sporodiniella umbellata]
MNWSGNGGDGFLNMLTPNELDMSGLVDHPLWPMPGTLNASFPMEPLGGFWMPQVKQAWYPIAAAHPHQKPLFPPTPPETGVLEEMQPHCLRQITPPATPYQQTFNLKRTIRRKSDESHKAPTRTYRRRASSHPSVASVVSLSAHEPVTSYLDGIEHITFLYSHERQVKEYTVRTDVASVSPDRISLEFRAQNSIYPRANVPQEEYDGNRWEYETSCNRLGWELCWLNPSQLCGRRGLIQRAVDSYRNRHAEMRSRRVTRQEKVANGTLRKRRVKKSIDPSLEA